MKKKISATKLVLITSIGGALEFFDFTIFALFSIYISQAFFPGDSHLKGLINTFAIFAVGYFARPLGGLIISHLGDRRGRKLSLLISVNMMAITTLLTGILPGYQTLGILAPILLIVLRLLQGAAVGGEIPGVLTFLVEYFHQKNPTPAIAITLAGITFGNVIASALGLYLTSHLSHASMIAWGWRVPFFIGSLLGFLGFIIRRNLHETDLFERILILQTIHRVPVFTLFKKHKKEVLTAACLTALTTATIFVFLYLPTYSKTVLGRPIHHSYLISTICFIVMAVFTGIFGLLSKYFHSWDVILTGGFASIVLASLGSLFLGLQNGLAIYCVLLAIVAALVNSCYTYVICQLFPTNVRYTGIAISYNIGVAFFGAITPLIMTLTFKYFDTQKAPFIILSVASIITILALIYSRKLFVAKRQKFFEYEVLE